MLARYQRRFALHVFNAPAFSLAVRVLDTPTAIRAFARSRLRPLLSLARTSLPKLSHPPARRARFVSCYFCMSVLLRSVLCTERGLLGAGVVSVR